jgi:hypothetical protein
MSKPSLTVYEGTLCATYKRLIVQLSTLRASKILALHRDGVLWDEGRISNLLPSLVSGAA